MQILCPNTQTPNRRIKKVTAAVNNTRAAQLAIQRELSRGHKLSAKPAHAGSASSGGSTSSAAVEQTGGNDNVMSMLFSSSPSSAHVRILKIGVSLCFAGLSITGPRFDETGRDMKWDRHPSSGRFC